MSALVRSIALTVAIFMIATLFTATEQIGHQTWFPPPYLDKVAHMGYYGIIAFLLDRGFALRLGWPVVIITSLVGAADEWHQLYFVNRGSDVFDWLADTMAAVLMVCGSRGLLQRWNRRTRHVRALRGSINAP